MPDRKDVLDELEPLIRSRPESSPWVRDPSGSVAYEPDYALLSSMLTIPISDGSSSESGRLAKAIDAWVAAELRRSGFKGDEVWPRLTRPRVMSRELARYVGAFPTSQRDDAMGRLLRTNSAAPNEASVLGLAYVKQVDVVVAHWSTGPEILVSTKGMVRSFRKNLANRFEEAYGDAKNLRGRFPLAAIGFLFMMRSTVVGERGSLERAIDMLRKLKTADGYDATGLILVEWDESALGQVALRHDPVPQDLSSGAFLATIVERTLERSPVDFHVEARELREFRAIPLEDEAP